MLWELLSSIQEYANLPRLLYSRKIVVKFQLAPNNSINNKLKMKDSLKRKKSPRSIKTSPVQQKLLSTSLLLCKEIILLCKEIILLTSVDCVVFIPK